MKLFQTGSATVVSDCMNFFHFLPVSHRIDIRTAKFFENFMCSENYICTLFETKLTVRKSLLVVIPCRYSFRAHLSSCEVSLSLRVSFAFRFHNAYFIFASCYAATSGD